MTLTRRQALMALLKEKRPVGYVPAWTYGIDRWSHPWMGTDPSYREVMEHVDRYDHLQVLHLSYYGSFGLTDILHVEAPGLVETRRFQQGDTTHTQLTLHTPRGDLTAEYKEIAGNNSVWRQTHLIKTDDDIDRFLSVPFTPAQPDADAYRRVRAEVGDRGIMQIQMPDPIDLVFENMDYNDFMVRTITVPEKIDAMLERMQQLTLQWLEGIIAAGMATESFRIFGPEAAAPPMMSPDFYHRAVTEMDRPIVRMIQEAGGIVEYHCHGPIARLIDEFLDLGVDAIDPCEAPPSGDIGLRDLAARVGDAITLVGNLQLDDLERATPAQIDRLVAEAVEAVGGRARFILAPTAPPFETPLPPQTARNIIAFLDAARRHGGAPPQ
ncbi:MAG: hypothetical protein M5R40_18890 [Anaerolineae bacterium]|nr:hypothetical protein [Anaerolineae bacterium]